MLEWDPRTDTYTRKEQTVKECLAEFEQRMKRWHLSVHTYKKGTQVLIHRRGKTATKIYSMFVPEGKGIMSEEDVIAWVRRYHEEQNA